MIIVSYVDADGKKEMKKRYRLPGDQVLREQVIPGQFGYPDMHVTHSQMQYEKEPVLIVVVTNVALTPEDNDAIQKEVWAFLDQK